MSDLISKSSLTGNEELRKKLFELLDNPDSPLRRLNVVDESENVENAKISELQKKVSYFLDESFPFSKGDIVKWKKGLKNRKYPKENQPCMVIDVLEEPIITDIDDYGSAYYREPLDLVLALLSDESNLLLFHYDKRRFEKVNV